MGGAGAGPPEPAPGPCAICLNPRGVKAIGRATPILVASRPPGTKMTAMSTQLQKITPFLWYAREAEEAARYYASIFPASRVDRIVAMPADSPSGPAGSVNVVDLPISAH